MFEPLKTVFDCGACGLYTNIRAHVGAIESSMMAELPNRRAVQMQLKYPPGEKAKTNRHGDKESSQ